MKDKKQALKEQIEHQKAVVADARHNLMNDPSNGFWRDDYKKAKAKLQALKDELKIP